MRFTSRRSLVGRAAGRSPQLLCCLALATWLGGCSVMPEIGFVPAGKIPSGDVSSGDVSSGNVSNGNVSNGNVSNGDAAGDQGAGRDNNAPAAPAEAELVRTANPYLLDPPPVPAAARAEFTAALQALYDKDYQLAQVRLLQLTSSYPQLSGPWLNLGLLYRATDRAREAEAALQQALLANPKNLQAYNQLAILKRQRGDFAAARADYEAALAIWPQHAASHRNLGILCEIYLGQLPEALYHYQQYLRLADKDAEVQAWVVALQRQLQDRNVASQ